MRTHTAGHTTKKGKKVITTKSRTVWGAVGGEIGTGCWGLEELAVCVFWVLALQLFISLMRFSVCVSQITIS